MAEKKESGRERQEELSACFVNRELSWLEFNRRVLMEADDAGTPLLERLKFLGIYQSNLEEFYMVRVGILTHRARMLPKQKDPCSGWVPEEQIKRILETTRDQQAVAEQIWRRLGESFRGAGVDVLDFRKASKVDELMSRKIFSDIRPLLLPRIVREDAALPFLWGKESYVVAWLGREKGSDVAIIPLHRVPAYTAFEIDGRQKIVLTDQLVLHFLPQLFKKTNIRDSAVIRVTRNADVFLSEHIDVGDLRGEMSAMLKKRNRQQPVRLQIYGKLSSGAKSYLMKSLRIQEARVFVTSMPFDLSFRSAVKAPPELRYPERKSSRSVGLTKGEFFPYIARHDLVLSYPFQSMNPFVDLLYEAADDPEVESIRITLYRLAANSKVAAALAYAADRGKRVLALLELRARFDEQNNIDYSEVLEDAGCHVIYGLPDKKVHCKLCLITRREGASPRYITQVGTGNYNEVTGEQYCDLTLVTGDSAVAWDAERIFQALVLGQTPPATTGSRLWCAPLRFKQPLLELLDREIAKGPQGRVSMKVNSVNHVQIMKKLVECSQAGVRVELFVRGICCLRPGIPGYTDHITVKSIVGRWLEHSRIYRFGEGEDERMFIGSGDLLTRNVERRVEVFLEVTTPETRAQIREVLDAERADRSKGWLMQPDGRYLLDPGPEDSSSQEALYRYFHGRTVECGASQEKTPAAQTGIPGAAPAQPATLQAGAAQDEAPQDETAKSGNVQAGTTQTGSTQSGNAQPEGTQPEVTQPQYAQPGNVLPETVQPETVQRGTAQPGTAQPQNIPPAAVQPGNALSAAGMENHASTHPAAEQRWANAAETAGAQTGPAAGEKAISASHTRTGPGAGERPETGPDAVQASAPQQARSAGDGAAPGPAQGGAPASVPAVKLSAAPSAAPASRSGPEEAGFQRNAAVPPPVPLEAPKKEPAPPPKPLVAAPEESAQLPREGGGAQAEKSAEKAESPRAAAPQAKPRPVAAAKDAALSPAQQRAPASVRRLLTRLFRRGRG